MGDAGRGRRCDGSLEQGLTLSAGHALSCKLVADRQPLPAAAACKFNRHRLSFPTTLSRCAACRDRSFSSGPLFVSRSRRIRTSPPGGSIPVAERFSSILPDAERRTIHRVSGRRTAPAAAPATIAQKSTRPFCGETSNRITCRRSGDRFRRGWEERRPDRPCRWPAIRIGM